MTPAQLDVLIEQHNALHSPDQSSKHARTRAREYDDPADLIMLANTKIGV